MSWQLLGEIKCEDLSWKSFEQKSSNEVFPVTFQCAEFSLIDSYYRGWFHLLADYGKELGVDVIRRIWIAPEPKLIYIPVPPPLASALMISRAFKGRLVWIPRTGNFSPPLVVVLEEFIQ